jgi:hypothetical protein
MYHAPSGFPPRVDLAPAPGKSLAGSTPAGRYEWGVIALVLFALAFVTRAQFFGNPLLDSDEGFYLLVGDRIVHGALPYVDIWDRKPIGLFLLYAGMRLLGGDGVLAYQLVGTLFAFCTALLVARLARPFSSSFAAAAAGAAYLLWLPLGAAAGGQAELFLNLPLAGAGLLTRDALRERGGGSLAPHGIAAMLLVGVAAQIKYTGLLPGIFLGCCWLVAGWRGGRRGSLLSLAGLWILAAIAPTMLAASYYAARGDLGPFVYANFLSVWQRAPTPSMLIAIRLAVIAAMLLPLLACIRLRPPRGTATLAYRFTLAWLAASLLGLLAFGTYFEQYALPALIPASAAAGLCFSRRKRLPVCSLLVVVMLLGQVKLWLAQCAHGSRREARSIVAEVDPDRCLFVYSGVAALYRMSHACIATRFAFPSHLSRAREAAAIGIDPVREVDRIMQHRPGTVIVRSPYAGDENWPARAELFHDMAGRYRLALRESLGWKQVDVYRLRPQLG